MVFDNIEATFELDSCTTILWPPGFLYRMWPGSNMKQWSLDPYQHNKIIEPFVSFQLIKFGFKCVLSNMNFSDYLQTQDGVLGFAKYINRTIFK